MDLKNFSDKELKDIISQANDILSERKARNQQRLWKAVIEACKAYREGTGEYIKGELEGEEHIITPCEYVPGMFY